MTAIDRPTYVLISGAVYAYCRDWRGNPVYLCRSMPEGQQAGRRGAPRISYPPSALPAHTVLDEATAGALIADGVARSEARIAGRTRKAVS